MFVKWKFILFRVFNLIQLVKIILIPISSSSRFQTSFHGQTWVTSVQAICCIVTRTSWLPVSLRYKRRIAFREIDNFSNTIFFRQHKWMTKLFFNNTTKKVFYLQHWIWFAFGAARLVEFRLVSVGENGVARCWESSVCCRTCEGLCLESSCSFVSGI